MRSKLTWLLAASAMAAAVTGTVAPAAAQPFGYGYDDAPPPFRRGPGFDRPPGWGPGDGWRHRRHWRDEGFDRRGGGRDGDRRGGRDRDRFGGGDDNDGGGRGNRGGVRPDDNRRGQATDEVPRRGQGRGGPSPFGGRESD